MMNSTWESLLAMTTTQAQIHENVAAQITERVVDAIAGMLKDMENQKKQVRKKKDFVTESTNTFFFFFE